MAKKIVTLYIDDTSLRLLVANGRQVKKWADMSLEPGLVKNGVVIKESEVAFKIKELFKAQRERTRRVILGVSGLHCLSRPITFPYLPKALLEEAVRQEAKTALPVPLEQLHISWQTIPSPEGKTQVFLVAIPIKTANVLLKVLRQAGLKPNLMDLKPLLLARVVKEATAIIVDIQSNEFDIVIMGDGIPQPIRTVPFHNGGSSWQEKLLMIGEELDRTIKFYNSNNPEKQLVSTVPIFVSGKLAEKQEFCSFLSDKFGHPVLPLPTPLECPDGLDPSLYMANIGLILNKLSPDKETVPLVTNLNILPTYHQPKPLSLVKIVTLPSIAISIVLLVFLVMLINNTYGDIAQLHYQLESTNQIISQRQELQKNINTLKKTIKDVQLSHGNFNAALNNLENQGNEVNGNLKATIDNLPSSLNLSSISYANGIFTLNGKATNEREVLSYLKNLDANSSFSTITVNSITRIEGEGVDFTLILRLEGQN